MRMRLRRRLMIIAAFSVIAILYFVRLLLQNSAVTRHYVKLKMAKIQIATKIKMRLNVSEKAPLELSDPCFPNPCLNRANCSEYRKIRYRCVCRPGFMGENCDHELDEIHKDREQVWEAAVKKSANMKKTWRTPDVIGIGVEKCGTDALITFLKNHPLVKTSMLSETQFFNARYGQGMSKYLSMFPQVTDDEILMEKSPAYFNFPPYQVPFRIKTYIPRAKIILVLCDPVNRTYSDFVHEKIVGGIWIESNFDDFVAKYLEKYNSSLIKKLRDSDSSTHDYIAKVQKSDRASHIITTGLYYYHLLRWLEAFGKDNLHILNGEKLISQPGLEIEKLQDYLGLPKLLLKEDFVKNENTGFYCFSPMWSQKMKMAHHTKCLSLSKGRTRNKPREASKRTIKSLMDFYRPFNKKLFELLHQDMGWQ